MFDARIIEDLADRLSAIIPPGAAIMRDELRKQFRVILQQTLREHFNLVSREEFDAQVAVLARTREKVEALEKTLGKPQA